jgi:DNA-binding transcriptional LysR family regulator
MTPGGEQFDLVSLQLLVAIGDRASIGKAARDLGLSQPSASLRLSELERKVGMALVQRSPTGSRLTAAGVSVAGWARHVVDASDAFTHSVAALRDSQGSRLAVAVSKTIADHLMPWWLVTMHNVRPDITVALAIGDPDEAVNGVRAGEADLGFVEGNQPAPRLRCREIGSDEIMVVVAPGHPLLRERQPLTLQRLAEVPLVLRESGCGSRQTLEEELASVGLRPSVRTEMASTAAIKAMVSAGDGVTVLSRLSVTPEVRAGRLVAVSLADRPMRLRFRAVWRQGAQPTQPGRDLLSIAIGASGTKPGAPGQRGRRG